MVKQKVAIVFGGVSSEHEVSRVSAASVVRAIDKEKFEAVLIGITKNEGRWLLFNGSPEEMEDGSWEHNPGNLPAFIAPDRSVHGAVVVKNGGAENLRLDAVFPVLHGKNGEDGTIQGLFELSGIPYVGCSVLASAVCMDKAVTNSLLDHFSVKRAEWGAMMCTEMDRFDELADRFERNLNYPIFVKPANAGSSVGISKARNRAELKDALVLAFLHDDKAVLERTVVGKELECSVLGNREPIASEVGEILPANEFYDYEAKYHSSASETRIPASITPEQSLKIRETAIKAYTALGCEGLSRVDFFLETATGEVLLNEINTIPGFTSISMYGKMMEYSGVPYTELITRLIGFAIERSER